MVLSLCTELCNHHHNQFENIFIIPFKNKIKSLQGWQERLLVLKAEVFLGSREAGPSSESSSVGLLSCLESGQWQVCDSGLAGAVSLRVVGHMQAFQDQVPEFWGPQRLIGEGQYPRGMMGPASPTPPALLGGPWHFPHLRVC